MSTETEITEVHEQKSAAPESKIKDNEYKIFDYFKGHTTLFVTVVSALVAIMSFIFRFAVSRMNYAYLAYWDIALLHANDNNPSELYMVVCLLLFAFSLLLIRSFLSKMADTFRYYFPLLLMINRGINISKRDDKKLLKEIKKISCKFDRLPPKAQKSAKGKAINEKVKRSRESIENDLNRLERIRKSRQKIVRIVLLQTTITIVLAYLLGSFFLSLVNMTATVRENLFSSQIVVLFIFIELVYQYVPACFAAIRLNKQYKDEEIPDKVVELCDEEKPMFPHEHLIKLGIKSIFTDKTVKTVIAHLLIGVVILLSGMSFTGTLTAEKTRYFPIYSAEEKLYAVVYTSGSTRYMEEAIIEDRTLIIDTTKQRVITSDDISYRMGTFDEVSVIRIDDADKIEQISFPISKVLNKIGSFFEALMNIIGEALTKNAECVPRVE